MDLALAEAAAAAEMGEVPVGAVVVHEGKVISSAHNRREVDGGKWRRGASGCWHLHVRLVGVAVALFGPHSAAGFLVAATIHRCSRSAAESQPKLVLLLRSPCLDSRSGICRTSRGNLRACACLQHQM